MITSQIRREFVNFFCKKGHKVINGSSVVPFEDNSLFFVNAGMVQFKKFFLGIDNLYPRIVSCQNCIRVGGKHNDLNNIGISPYHHTFFEMMGNFSFGDYFKINSIKYSWEFVTNILKIPEKNLLITVYKEDKETFDIWKNYIGIQSDKIFICDFDDNFWMMGETGPCGPCSEIFYDKGANFGGNFNFDKKNRFVEIWNLVFMEFNRNLDGSLISLPKKSVDTGIGLERISSVIQNKNSSYEIDLFFDSFNILNDFYNGNKCSHENIISSRIVVDHLRSAFFIICSDILPTSDGRGYILRKIIRRIIFHSNKLGIKDKKLTIFIKQILISMSISYSFILNFKNKILEIFENECLLFMKVINNNIKYLYKKFENVKSNFVSGSIIFDLYDTYGIPLDIIRDISNERNFIADFKSFYEIIDKRKKKEKNLKKTVGNFEYFGLKNKTLFTGYEKIKQSSFILFLLDKDKNRVKCLKKGEHGFVILDKTPFYAQGGGQVGDIGFLFFNKNLFKVQDTYKYFDIYVHEGVVENGCFFIDTCVKAVIDFNFRNSVSLNHSATHLLHSSLKLLLGKEVNQKGSFVTSDFFRFDFCYNNSLSFDMIFLLEEMINFWIRSNFTIEIKFLDFKKIKNYIISLFDYKYKDKVRTVNISDVSNELCAGTHVNQTGEIGFFKIINEFSVSSGVRRIEAITGKCALNYIFNNYKLIHSLSSIMNKKSFNLKNGLSNLLIENKLLKKKIINLDKNNINYDNNCLLFRVRTFRGIKIIFDNLLIDNTKIFKNFIKLYYNIFYCSFLFFYFIDCEKIKLILNIDIYFFDYFEFINKFSVFFQLFFGGNFRNLFLHCNNYVKFIFLLDLVVDLVFIC